MIFTFECDTYQRSWWSTCQNAASVFSYMIFGQVFRQMILFFFYSFQPSLCLSTLSTDIDLKETHMPDTTHQLYALYLDSHVYLSTQTAIFFRTDILLFSKRFMRNQHSPISGGSTVSLLPCMCSSRRRCKFPMSGGSDTKSLSRSTNWNQKAK